MHKQTVVDSDKEIDRWSTGDFEGGEINPV